MFLTAIYLSLVHVLHFISFITVYWYLFLDVKQGIISPKTTPVSLSVVMMSWNSETGEVSVNGAGQFSSIATAKCFHCQHYLQHIVRPLMVCVYFVTSFYVQGHELIIISLTHCQDKHSRNKREWNYSMPKLMERFYYYNIFAMYWSALRISEDDQIFSSIPLLQRGRYNVDVIELLCVDTVLTNKLYMKSSLSHWHTLNVLSSQPIPTTYLRSFGQWDVHFSQRRYSEKSIICA